MGARTSTLGLARVGVAGGGAAGAGWGAVADLAAVRGRVGFFAVGDEVGAFLLGVTRVWSLGFFAGAGTGEGFAERVAAAAGRAGRRGEGGTGGVGFGSVSGGVVAGAGATTTIVAGGTALRRRASLLFWGEDFSAGSARGATGGTVGPGGVGASPTAGRFGFRVGVAGPTGTLAAAGTGAGGGGVGTGSFFPVRGERDLGGMSRTLGDADHRVGLRLGGSLNCRCQAAQTVFRKVLV